MSKTQFHSSEATAAIKRAIAGLEDMTPVFVSVRTQLLAGSHDLHVSEVSIHAQS